MILICFKILLCYKIVFKALYKSCVICSFENNFIAERNFKTNEIYIYIHIYVFIYLYKIYDFYGLSPNAKDITLNEYMLSLKGYIVRYLACLL